MISTKPVPSNARHPICNNFDPDSNVTEESNPHFEKHLSLKTSTDPGRKTNSRSIFVNYNNSIRDNVDPVSIATDFSCRMQEKHSEAIDSIPEGSQSLRLKKFPEAIDETYRMTPLTTINR
jgi:hypothetical protein